MYEAFYSLNADPFCLSPDHRFCFEHRSYVKAIANIMDVVDRAEGFVMITGEGGTGKTTLSNDLWGRLAAKQMVVGRMTSTPLSVDDFLRTVAFAFDLPVEGADKATVLELLEDFVTRQGRVDRPVLLVVDDVQEAHSLALKELLPLINFQLSGQTLMQVLLIGDDSLRETLLARDMVPPHQRFRLESLDSDETASYVKHRLGRAGWRHDPQISEEIFPWVHEFSHGLPHRINLVCRRLLWNGSVDQKHELGEGDLRRVIKELREESLATPDERLDNAANRATLFRPDRTRSRPWDAGEMSSQLVDASTEGLPGGESVSDSNGLHRGSLAREILAQMRGKDTPTAMKQRPSHDHDDARERDRKVPPSTPRPMPRRLVIMIGLLAGIVFGFSVVLLFRPELESLGVVLSAGQGPSQRLEEESSATTDQPPPAPVPSPGSSDGA